MVTKSEHRALAVAPPVIGGLVGVLISVWAAAFPNEPYTKALVTGIAPIAIACDRASSSVMRYYLEKRADRRLALAIAVAKKYKSETNNQAYKKGFDAKINRMQNERLDLLANRNPPKDT
ncbi:hypothetical protein [Duganella sp.]|uniref:hypothetical protein n=1 Tax=Duganella sp. TaxID=1904440 RepID=UPI0031E48DD0